MLCLMGKYREKRTASRFQVSQLKVCSFRNRKRGARAHSVHGPVQRAVLYVRLVIRVSPYGFLLVHSGVVYIALLAEKILFKREYVVVDDRRESDRKHVPNWRVWFVFLSCEFVTSRTFSFSVSERFSSSSTTHLPWSPSDSKVLLQIHKIGVNQLAW